VGLAGLLGSLGGARRIAVVGVATACVLWSVYLGLGHAFGASQSDGAFEVATRHSAGQFAHLTWSYSRLRHVVDHAP
jgi:hypothetical protein